MAATKKAEVVSALKAFEATYKAACRAHAVAAHKPLLQQLQQCQDASKPLEKVVLQGAAVRGEQVQAVAECLACCSSVHTLRCLNCNISNKGLAAVAALVRASGCRWWQRCRLQALEICGDGRLQQPGALDARSTPAAADATSLAARASMPEGRTPVSTDIHTGTCLPLPANLLLQLPDNGSARDPYSLQQVHDAIKAPRPLMEALQQLSLALGVGGLRLTRLVLDHTLLGDSGISILSAGLGRCSSLAALSLQYCGIGPMGVQELASALQPTSTSSRTAPGGAGGDGRREQEGSPCAPHPAGPAAATAAPGAGARGDAAPAPPASISASQQHGGASSGSPPQLAELVLSGNHLGPAGLQHLGQALRHLGGLQLLGLADIGLDAALQPGSQAAVQALAHGLLASPSTVASFDFENIIGDGSAVYLVSLVKAKPSMRYVKLSARISPSIQAELASLCNAHALAAKAASKPVKKAAS